jgi:ubiquitin C-terminal hydrolase
LSLVPSQGPPEYISADLLGVLMNHMRGIGSNIPLGNSQECANEGLIYTLDALGSSAEVFHNEYERGIKCPSCGNLTPLRDKSYYIMVEPSVKAGDLSVYLQRHNELHTEYVCEECGSKNDINRTERLKQLRECIVIMYNKFAKKSLAEFPTELKFPALPKGTFLTYQLVAQIEHIGGMGGGHYYSIVRRGNEWYNINDSSVRKSAPIPTTDTFMLFYNLVAS